MEATILGNYHGYYGTFVENLYTVYGDRSYKLCIKDRIGNASELLKFKAFLLSAYLEILVDYENAYDEDDTNFFSTSEIAEVLQHFNNLAKSFVYKDFTA